MNKQTKKLSAANLIVLSLGVTKILKEKINEVLKMKC